MTYYCFRMPVFLSNATEGRISSPFVPFVVFMMRLSRPDGLLPIVDLVSEEGQGTKVTVWLAAGKIFSLERLEELVPKGNAERCLPRNLESPNSNQWLGGRMTVLTATHVEDN
jgi:hypothetical protein